MRILIVVPQFPDSFARNIAVTLEQMGFQVSTGVPGLMKGRADQKLNPLLSMGSNCSPVSKTDCNRVLCAARKRQSLAWCW